MLRERNIKKWLSETLHPTMKMITETIFAALYEVSQINHS